jgi:hypothetical protein
MVIDISTTLYSNLNLSYKNEYLIKSNKLLTELNKMNIKMNIKHNYIIIPMSVYNILEHNDNFSPVIYKSGDGPVLVGTIGEFKCYLDIHLPPDEILVSWDKQTARDVKINSILKGIDEKEKRVKIIS